MIPRNAGKPTVHDDGLAHAWHGCRITTDSITVLRWPELFSGNRNYRGV